MTAMLIVFFTSAFFHEYLISGEFAQRAKRETSCVHMAAVGILDRDRF